MIPVPQSTRTRHLPTLALAALGGALVAVGALSVSATPSFAQADEGHGDGGGGHSDGGHSDGGHEDDGHTDGDHAGGSPGGHGKGKDQAPAPSAGQLVAAQSQEGGRTPDMPVTPGTSRGAYLRAELGAFSPDPSGGFWETPGPGDPRIDFDVDMDANGMGAFAIGYDWQNGFRGEVALNFFGNSFLSGPCSATSDGSPCADHADITGASVTSSAAMFNVYYSPRQAMGNRSRVQPFVTAGIGFARNTMSEWTRTNATLATGGESRTFEGATNTDLAWSVGLGVAVELDRGSKWPATLEATWRYFDLGTATGGSTPVSDTGGVPIVPFRFENRTNVISIGIRIPLGGR